MRFRLATRPPFPIQPADRGSSARASLYCCSYAFDLIYLSNRFLLGNLSVDQSISEVLSIRLYQAMA